MTSAENRIIALEEHARVTSQALGMAVALVRALAISNGALFALLDASTRETMRAAARPVIAMEMTTRRRVPCLKHFSANRIRPH